MSELFADMEEDVMALTLWHRVLKWIERLVTALYDVLGLSVSEIGQLIVNSYIEPPFKHAQLEKKSPPHRVERGRNVLLFERTCPKAITTACSYYFNSTWGKPEHIRKELMLSSIWINT